MDIRDVRPGNTLCLRSELEGALLVLGDVHAAQGDGEILGLAAECAADVRVRVVRDLHFRSPRPMIGLPGGFVALACRAAYYEARDVAVRDATTILARLSGATEEEAYLYVTTVGNLRNGAVWSMGRTEPAWMRAMPLVVGVEVALSQSAALER